MQPIIHPSNHPSFHSPTYPFTHPSIHLPIRSSTHSFTYLPIHPLIHPSILYILAIHSYIHSSSQQSNPLFTHPSTHGQPRIPCIRIHSISPKAESSPPSKSTCRYTK